MSEELRPLSLTIDNIRGIEHAELRLKRMPPGQGQFIKISAPNGAGKTSLMLAIDGLLSGGHRPDLIRDGCDKSRISMLLSDGTEVERTITRKGHYPKVTPAEGAEAPKGGLESYFKKLGSGFGFNPPDFIAKKDKRLDYLMKVMPMEFSLKELLAAIGNAGPLVTTPAGALDLNGVNKFIRDLIEKRAQIGSRKDEKASSVETFRKSLALNDQGDQAKDWKAELVSLEKKRAGITSTESDEINAVTKAMTDLRLELAAKSRKAEDSFHEGIAELLAKARGGDVAFDDLGGADPLNLVRSDLKDIGAANFELSEAAKEAQTTIDQVRNENKAALEILAAEIATAKAGADQQIRDGAIRESMEKLRKEAQALAKDWDAVAAAIKALEELRTSKLKNFPVNGLEVREDNEVWMKGRKLDDWNKGEQLMYAFEIGILGAGELGLQVWDEYEHLDSENQKLVEETPSPEEFVVESGLTVLAFCVASAEEVKQHGKKLRSEPAGALVA